MACHRYRKPKISDFGFKVDDISVFHRPQWPRISCLALAVYRVVITLYVLGFFAVFVVFLILNQNGEPFLFLTTWAFVIFIGYNLAATYNIIKDGFIRRGNAVEEGVQVRHQVHWFLFAITTNLNFLVTIVYWGALHMPSIPLIYDLSVHTLPSIVCLIDLSVTALPVRLLHFVYPIAVGCVYVIFTLILWAGFDKDSLYFFLDYTNHPGKAVGAIVGILVAVVLMQCLIWGSYRLRLWLWSRYFNGDMSQVPVTESSSYVKSDEENTIQDVGARTVRL